MTLAVLMRNRRIDLAREGKTIKRWSKYDLGFADSGIKVRVTAAIDDANEVAFFDAIVDINENVLSSTGVHVMEV